MKNIVECVFAYRINIEIETGVSDYELNMIKDAEIIRISGEGNQVWINAIVTYDQMAKCKDVPKEIRKFFICISAQPLPKNRGKYLGSYMNENKRAHIHVFEK